MDLLRLADDWEWSGIALALALGLLVGIQRGWAQREDAPGTRFAGVRTFGLFGLAGGLAGVLFDRAAIVSAIILATSAGLILISYYRVSQRSDSVSGTTSLVGLITVACGFLATTGAHLAAIVITVTMVVLLAMRSRLHRLVRQLSEQEVTAIARFALIAMVILPLLPDGHYGPYGAWNPQKLWLVVVLVSGLSLVGYVAARLLGPSRGTIATAAAGSLVSSTAVTASLATRLKEESREPGIIHAGISAASAVMFLRVMAFAGLIAPFALPTLVRLAVPGLLVSLAATVWFLRQARQHPAATQEAVEVRNPFAIGPALILMAMVMAMTVAARWVLARFGDAELAVVLAISGSVDVDSAVITMGSLPAGTLQPQTAGLVLLAPTVLNTLFKAGTAIGIAGWRRVSPAAVTLLLSALASLVAVPLVL